MGLNETPMGERTHIGFFGLRNAGKSSVVNAFTNQQLAIVSDVKGTTTDPVTKAMELLPIGPVTIIDTPGIDDEGSLGEMRVQRCRNVLAKVDIAILVVDGNRGMEDGDRDLLQLIGERKIPYIIVYNKADLIKNQSGKPEESGDMQKDNEIWVSAKTNENIVALREMVSRLRPDSVNERHLVADFIQEEDVVVLVVPIDSSAPKGRLILPQQQAIRDILEVGGISMVTRDSELAATLASLKKPPRLVITDSQALSIVKDIVPKDVPLTTFSILMARYKGTLTPMVEAAKSIDTLPEGAHILISEGCSHHRQCEDIGTVKLPKWMEEYTGKHFQYDFTSGGTFLTEEELNHYDLVVHCGGCMLTPNEMAYRVKCAGIAHVPITNYGVMIGYMNGVLNQLTY